MIVSFEFDTSSLLTSTEKNYIVTVLSDESAFANNNVFLTSINNVQDVRVRSKHTVKLFKFLMWHHLILSSAYCNLGAQNHEKEINRVTIIKNDRLQYKK